MNEFFEFLKKNSETIYEKIGEKVNKGKDLLSTLSKKDSDKDVYDVISDRANKSFKEFLLVLPKLATLVFRANKLKSEGKDLGPIEHDLILIIKKIVPVAIDASHHSYEVYKEIDYNYGNDRLLEYVKENGKNPLEFAYNYNSNKNVIMKFLAILSILDEEGVNLDYFNDPSIALRVLQGESEMDIVSEKFDNLSPESVKEIDNLLDKETSYLDLTPEQINRLDRYHYKYMNNNVYPNMTENNNISKPEDRVLKLASKLGNKQISK